MPYLFIRFDSTETRAKAMRGESFPFVFLFTVAFQSLLWYGESEKAEKGRDTHGKTKAV